MHSKCEGFDEVFDQLLKNGDKGSAVLYALDRFTQCSEDVLSFYRFYQDFLLPPLYRWDCNSEVEAMCIWNEHMLSSAIRTVIEALYPHVVRLAREKFPEPDKPKVVVLCPEEEYHDIGARVISDYFLLHGFDSIHVGANTPTKAVMAALPSIRPKFVSISVTNPIHMVATRKMIQTIRESLQAPIRIVVGGKAFSANPSKAQEIGADQLLESFDDIRNLMDWGTKEGKS